MGRWVNEEKEEMLNQVQHDRYRCILVTSYLGGEE